MLSNEHPDMSGSGCDDDPFLSEQICKAQEEGFIAGAQQMRALVASLLVDQSLEVRIRQLWIPEWGTDPGKPDAIYKNFQDALP